MGISDIGQYSTIRSLFGGSTSVPRWVPQDDQDRILAYQQYDQMYWSNTGAFQLARRGTEIKQIYVPDGKTIVDSTAHYLLKGLQITPATGGDGSALNKALTSFLRKTRWMSQFMTTKHTGVVWGDWLQHLVADPSQPEGERVAFVPVDPASYFPVWDEDDQRRIKVVLAQEIPHPTKKDKAAIQRLTYWINSWDEEVPPGRVAREERIVEADEHWFDEDEYNTIKVTRAANLLPEGIRNIPLYHFRNQGWMGQPYGSSELRGFERIMAGINQTISDEELALALEGLGVYGTDGGSPVDDAGNAVDWEISPGKVVEVPAGAYFKRVEGVASVAPMLEHVKYLEEKLWESSGTFRAGSVDVQAAESGIALAVRFIPTAAKLEERDIEGVDLLNDMWLDWTFWQEVYEDQSFSSKDSDREFDVKLGDKLPLNREGRVAELNNMIDRHIIDRQYYRDEMAKLGYTFPDDIEERVQEEREADQEFTLGDVEDPKETITEQAGGPTGPDGRPLPSGNPGNPNEPTKPQPGNKSNNKGKVNESNGTETGQSLRSQTRPAVGRGR